MVKKHLLFPFALLCTLCGCLDLGGGFLGGDEPISCRPMSTVGELGRVEFAMDYPTDEGGSRSYAASAGRVWAVGSITTMTLKDVESGYALSGFSVDSSDPDVIVFEQDSAGSSHASFRVVGPGDAYLRVLSAGRLYDRVELAARRPESILTVTAVDGHLSSTHGWIAHGLGEPGLVLATGKACYLLFGPGSDEQMRLDGSFDLQVEATQGSGISVEFVDAMIFEGWPLHVYRVIGLEPSLGELLLTSGQFSDRFPVRVQDEPVVDGLQIDLVDDMYVDPDVTENRSAGARGSLSGPLVPRASDANGWSIHGLTYEFDHVGAEIEIVPDPGGEIAYFRPLEAGEVTFRITRRTSGGSISAEASYHIAE